MVKWKVTATLKAAGNDAVDMQWQHEGTEMGAISCVSQLFLHDSDDDGSPFHPELLAIKIEKVA